MARSARCTPAARPPTAPPTRSSSTRYPKGRIRQHVVEVLAGIPSFDSVLPKMMLAMSCPLISMSALQMVGLGVQLLPIHHQPSIGVEFGEVLIRDRQHAPGSRGWIVDGPHYATLGQGRVIFNEQQVDHQPDDLARREVLSGGLVGEFCELPDQFLEHRPHLGVADRVRVQVDTCKLLGHQIQQSGLGQSVDLGVEVEGLEDVPHGGGTPGDRRTGSP